MAVRKFVGAAQSVAQVETITIGGTWSSTETATISVGEKSVVFTCGGSETPSTVAAGLQALAAASDHKEFEEITWSVNAEVITAIGPSGKPVTIDVSEASTSGTIVDAVVTNATGPNHWDNAANWSGSTLPVGGDSVYIDSNYEVRYGLPTSLALALLDIKEGQLGLPSVNEAGYPEYRTQRAVVGATSLVIGDRDNSGPSLVKLSLDAVASTVVVHGTKSGAGFVPVDLLFNNASAVISVLSGSVGIAIEPGATSTLGTVNVSNRGTVEIGTGTTVTNLRTSGTVYLSSTCTNITISNGSVELLGTSASTAVIMTGGLLTHKSSGTITSLTVGPGQVDCSQDTRTKTITLLVLNPSGSFSDPHHVVSVPTIQKGSLTNKLDAS